MSDNNLPLQGLRVVDITDGVAGVVGRLLAELGADVILVEPPEGAASRRAEPLHNGHGLRFATTHANKRGVVCDLATEQDRETLLELTDHADIVVESSPPGHLAGLGLGQKIMRQRNEQLVVASVTDFGQSGPYRNWRASDAVLTAMASMLSRSGAPHREPLVPPGELAGQTAAISSAFAVLVAYHHAQHTGHGDYIDCSLFDLTVQDLDPGLGMAGTATMGRSLLELPPGRPDATMLYPVLPCADGHVRMFIASPKQWNALYEWMGKPEEFADPSYSQIFTRFTNWSKIRPVLEHKFSELTRAEITSHGSKLGIAVSALRTADEILVSDHVRERNSFANAEIAPGLKAAIPNGILQIDGARVGFRHRAPTLDEHAGAKWIAEKLTLGAAHAIAPTRPLDGVRVLDLGVIVVGAETGRALADQGADVIKVENRDFLDGARQADSPDRCSHAFAVGNRGKRSLGLNLRSSDGKQLFLDLVAVADVVLTNFKPGTLESLGLDYEALRAINPRIILVESSALGSTGPWSTQMGYGPLVRATVGLTTLWRHPDAPQGFGDDMTVYPDHAAARAGVTGVVAALVERERTGTGRKINLAQMEIVFSQLATDYVRESLEPGTMVARGNSYEFDAPTGVYSCTGDDAYCAITVDGNAEWQQLAAVIGRPDLVADPRYATAADRVAHRDELDAIVAGWAIALTPSEAQSRLQEGGVPAGAVRHVADLLTDPHLAARHKIGALAQPGFEKPIPVTTGPALFENLPAPQLTPASLMAADTRDVLHEVLGLSGATVDALVESGVVEAGGVSNVTV